jgi:hypothetical protein
MNEDKISAALADFSGSTSDILDTIAAIDGEEVAELSLQLHEFAQLITGIGALARPLGPRVNKLIEVLADAILTKALNRLSNAYGLTSKEHELALGHAKRLGDRVAAAAQAIMKEL